MPSSTITDSLTRDGAYHKPELLQTRFYAPRSIAARLFVTCWMIYVAHVATNTVREIYLALSIAERLSFRVDEYGGLHHDLFETPGRGWHIGNNPGASMIAAIPYALLRPVTDRVIGAVNRQRSSAAVKEPPEYHSPLPMAREFYRQAWLRGYDVKFGLASIIMQAFVMAPISAAAVVLMFFLLRDLSGSDRLGLWLSLLYGFGTPIFLRTAFLNQNLLVAHAALLGFALLWGRTIQVRNPALRYFAAGFLAGITLLMDYTGAVLICMIFCYGLLKAAQNDGWTRSLVQGGWYILGAVPPVLLLMWYQYQSFGHPLFPGQHWMPNQNQFVQLGYQGLSTPEPALFLANAFDWRFGLFSSCPLLLLAFLSRERKWVPNLERIAMLVITAALFIFFSAVRYSWLQSYMGVRYMVPVIPFLFILAAGVLVRMKPPVALFVALASVVQAWSMSMYRDVEHGMGLLEPILHVFIGGFQLPLLTTLSQINQGWPYFDIGVSPLPVFAALAAVIYIIWSPRLWIRNSE